MNRGGLVAIGVAMCAAAAGPAIQAQDPPVLAKPVIEFTKTRFATVEQVFFWEGVNAERGYRIPESLWGTCRSIITRPDGTERVDRVGWPRDGMLYVGWLGGAGLGNETPQVGRYSVVFEFAGQQTRPYTFTVEDVPILNDISAEFVLPSPLALASRDDVVTLTVRNGSNQTIRFPHRGMMFGHVSIELEKTTGEKWGSQFFVPLEVLLKAASIGPSTFGEDTFLWKFVDRVPTVALAPGETYRLDLPLRAALTGSYGGKPLPTGEYDVRFSTTIQMLVGEASGPWADFAPFRIRVNSSAHGSLSP